MKGFGFISRAKGKDVFFFRTSIKNEIDLIEGSVVSFKIKTTEKGPQAVEITRRG